MIPKVIHYCWFGRNPLPESAVKCIDSWKKYLPDHEIKEWNEDNFNVNILPYTKDAYEARKFAFVSDYARFWVLYKFGGVYFDVDVEVIKPIDDILEKGAFWGFESEKGQKPAIAPGLGIASEAGNPVYKTILERYETMSFFEADGTMSKFSMIPMVTELFISKGLKADGTVECVEGNWFYPKDWFNPFDDATGRLNKTSNTRCIHWFMKSWLPPEPAWKKSLKRMIHRIFGTSFTSRIKKMLGR